MKRKTSRKKFAKKCKEINHLIRDMRTRPLKAIIKKLNEILVGYYHYYKAKNLCKRVCKIVVE